MFVVLSKIGVKTDRISWDFPSMGKKFRTLGVLSYYAVESTWIIKPYLDIWLHYYESGQVLIDYLLDPLSDLALGSGMTGWTTEVKRVTC